MAGFKPLNGSPFPGFAVIQFAVVVCRGAIGALPRETAIAVKQSGYPMETLAKSL